MYMLVKILLNHAKRVSIYIHNTALHFLLLYKCLYWFYCLLLHAI